MVLSILAFKRERQIIMKLVYSRRFIDATPYKTISFYLCKYTHY